MDHFREPNAHHIRIKIENNAALWAPCFEYDLQHIASKTVTLILTDKILEKPLKWCYFCSTTYVLIFTLLYISRCTNSRTQRKWLQETIGKKHRVISRNCIIPRTTVAYVNQQSKHSVQITHNTKLQWSKLFLVLVSSAGATTACTLELSSLRTDVRSTNTATHSHISLPWFHMGSHTRTDGSKSHFNVKTDHISTQFQWLPVLSHIGLPDIRCTKFVCEKLKGFLKHISTRGHFTP